jgi:hypothetical protein
MGGDKLVQQLGVSGLGCKACDDPGCGCAEVAEGALGLMLSRHHCSRQIQPQGFYTTKREGQEMLSRHTGRQLC